MLEWQALTKLSPKPNVIYFISHLQSEKQLVKIFSYIQVLLR